MPGSLNVPAARQPVLQFVQRNGLKAIGHEDEARRENYPELGLGSLDVKNWMQWAKDETGR